MLTRLHQAFKVGASHLCDMTLEEKVRYGMLAVTGAAVVANVLGVHISPLDIAGASGTS